MYFSFESIQTLALGFIAIFSIYWIKKPRTSKNEPPMVPYKIPVIGHTLSYLLNAEKFLAECREKYGDPFNIYVFGQVFTMVGNEVAHEVFNNSDTFDMHAALHDLLPINFILPINNEPNTVKYLIKTVREGITAKLDLYTSRIHKQAMIAMDKEIGDCSKPKVVTNFYDHAIKIIAGPVANVLVGEELACRDDVVNAFATFTRNVAVIAFMPPILSFIHPKFHSYVVTLPLKFGWNPTKKHMLTLKKQLKPMLEKRMKEKEALGDKYVPPLDVVEYCMSEIDFEISDTDKYLNTICEFLFCIVFASIHTTAQQITASLHDFGGRPELWDDLYEEQSRINKEFNGKITVEAIDKMVKLDSFLRESMRTLDSIIAIPHKCLDESFKFKNGMTIPKGRMILTHVMDIHYDTEVYGPEAKKFNPYLGLESNSSATKLGKNYYAFGSGKRACPGRFFATSELKIYLHKFILNYHIKTESGVVDEKKYLGPIVLPPTTGLIFENRKK